MPQTLLQSTLTRSALRSLDSSPPHSPPSSPPESYNPHNLPDFSILSLNPEVEREKLRVPTLKRTKSNGMMSDEDEDEVIEVSTPMMSIAATPITSSRSSSPTRLSKRVIRSQLESLSKPSTDPLKRLPEEIKSRIFLSLSVKDLKTCRRICKRWKRSAILNYAWFRQFQLASFIAPGGGDEEHVLDGGALIPTWTRRESREDWFFRYRNIKRRDDLNGPRDAIEALWEKKREEGWMSKREEKEARWESESQGSARSGKEEMREYYKGLSNSKTKDKKSRRVKDRTGYGDSSWD